MMKTFLNPVRNIGFCHNMFRANIAFRLHLANFILFCSFLLFSSAVVARKHAFSEQLAILQMLKTCSPPPPPRYFSILQIGKEQYFKIES